MFKLPESAQEVFNIMYKHLLTQNKKCFITVDNEKDIRCRYRGLDGMKCAAGCLIPDEKYSESMENVGWIGLTNRDQVPREHREMIHDAQMIHDWFEPELWKSELEKLATKYELTCPESR